MIRLIQASQYRCLRYVRQELGQFQILVGPNASGKSTFLDVLRLMRDLLLHGPKDAVGLRSPNVENLVWMGGGSRFELAVELEIPLARRQRLGDGFTHTRYEVALGQDTHGELGILGENLWLKGEDPPPRQPVQRELFPAPEDGGPVLFSEGKKSPRGWKKVVTKKAESGNDYYIAETTGWNNPFRLGPQRLALANLPEDEDRFPVAVWVKRVLMEGIQHLVLNSEAMQKPSPPGSPRDFQPDGSNLPWPVDDLSRRNPAAFERWVAHVRTALPDLKTVETVVREDDKHRYLRLVYETGLKAPSWTVSDGTLRLLALTLLAYLDQPGRVYLVEEPENGIHPKAVETVYQSLSSAYDSQVLCATHSPILLSLAEPDQLLCFARTTDGATDIVRGSEHPNLRDWKRGADLGTLFAAGVLG